MHIRFLHSFRPRMHIHWHQNNEHQQLTTAIFELFLWSKNIWEPCLTPSTGAITSSYPTDNLRNISRYLSLRVVSNRSVYRFPVSAVGDPNTWLRYYLKIRLPTYTNQRETNGYTLLFCGCHDEAAMKLA